MPKQSNANIKKNKRLAKLKKKEEKSSVGPSGQVAVLAQMKILEERLNKNLKSFSDAFAQNLEIIKQSFNITDVHFFVLRRILQDMAVGKARFSDEALKFKESNPAEVYEGLNAIDFDWYYKQFEEERKKAMEVAKTQEITKVPETTQEEPKAQEEAKPTEG